MKFCVIGGLWKQLDILSHVLSTIEVTSNANVSAQASGFRHKLSDFVLCPFGISLSL